jgi:hypothetical protein
MFLKVLDLDPLHLFLDQQLLKDIFKKYIFKKKINTLTKNNLVQCLVFLKVDSLTFKNIQSSLK